MTNLSPELQNRYVDCQSIAEGGMGFAYRAYDKERGQEVVLKFIRKELFGNRKSTKRFSREVIALKRLDHPNIVEVFDFVKDHDPPFFTMEYVDGESLVDLLERGTIDVRRLVEIILPVVSALAHSHELSIIHRDIKPDNIVLNRQGKPKLIDFGLAAQKSEEVQTQLTKTGEVLGTLDYLPPELICGAKSDARSDIYQIGVVMYAALAGRPPFSADNVVAFARKQMKTKIKSLCSINDKVDERLDGIVAKCLAIDPSLRYQSAKQLHKALEKWYTVSRSTKPLQRPLSDIGPIGDTGKMGAVTKPTQTSPLRTGFALLAIAIFLLVLFITPFEGGVLPEEKRNLPITSDTLRKLKLLSLKKAELLFVGPSGHLCELSGLSDEPILLKLKEGTAVSRSNFRLTIDLPQALVKERTVTITPLDKNKVAQKHAMRRFRLSPEEYLSSVLSPLDELKSESLTLLLKDLMALAKRFPHEGDVGDGRARVRALLRKHSLGDDEVQRLEKHIPSLIKTPIYLDSEAAERMYALFLIDVALADAKNLLAPWGKMYHHFGVIFSKGRVKRSKPWQAMCHRDVLRSTECLLGAMKPPTSAPRLPAIFLVSSDTVNRYTIRSTLFQEVHRELPKFLFQEDEIRPSVPRGLTQKASLQFVVNKDPASFKEALLVIHTAGFVRGTSLMLSLNEGPSMMVVNSATIHRHRWDLHVSIPLNPARLKKGANSCTITREMIGVFERSSDLLAIKSYGLWVRYHDDEGL